MTPEEALELINASEHTSYSLNAQYSGGEDHGAYRVVSIDGTRAVLKVNSNPQWIRQVERAKATTAHLAGLGYPVPKYLVTGSTDRGTYSLQSELPGMGVEPTPQAVTSLLHFIDLQRNQAISEVQGQDWVWYLMDVVFRGEWGLVRALMQFSADSSVLVTDIENLVLGLQGKMLPKTDLVHGDMGFTQVLLQNGAVSGVLDWNQAGYGDVTQDLMSLWYSLLGYADSRDLVLQQALQQSDREAVRIHAAYKMLADVSWHINKPGGDAVSAIARARIAIGLIRQT